MAALPAITVDSLGTALAGIPPLRRDPGTPADKVQALRWLTIAQRDPPGQWTDDAWQQANSFTNAVYIAVNTIMTALSGATVVVSERRPGVQRKSHSATGHDESDWTPLDPDHEIARLFADPNAVQTAGDFLAEYELCRSLFGEGIVYAVPGRDSKPAELWNLRKNYLTSITGVSPTYPSGAYRYMMPQPMLWSMTAGQLTIPREHVVRHKRPHPQFPWGSYSPLTGGGKMVDFLNGVIDSRQMAMDRGLSLDAIVAIAGSTDDERVQTDARFREKYTGSNRGQRLAVVDGERMTVQMLGTTPDKMSYSESNREGTAAVLALFGVPAVCAFLAEADYSGFFAAARAWREGNLAHESKGIGDTLTKHLIRPHWGPNYKVEVKLPPLMDPEQKERQWQLLNGMTSAVTFTVNEARAAFDMAPLDGGDVTPAERSAEVQKKGQPQPGGMPGMAGGEDDPIAALLGGQDPNAEPAAPGDVANPDVGTASDGSLPGKVQKGFTIGSIFDRLVSEVLA